MPSPFHKLWSLGPGVIFLNHGSFGACPTAILDLQQELRARLERDPVRVMQREAPAQIRASRDVLAELVRADPADLVFVHNATTGVNAVLRSLSFEPDDEVLAIDQCYGSCRSAMAYTCDRQGARLVLARLPFPIDSPDQAVEAILDAVTPRTRLAMIDHITSGTALVLPIQRIVAALEERGVDTLVDGAHAPGMVDLDVTEIGAAYYTGNCHKWLCTPKGAALLHVRNDRQSGIQPTAVSYYDGKGGGDPTPFQRAFQCPGTIDPTARMCVGPAIEWARGVFPGGLPAWRRRNHDLVIEARSELCGRWGTTPPCPAEMVGSMAVVPLPDHDPGARPAPEGEWGNPLQGLLFERYGIEVPVVGWPGSPRRGIRISAQAYNGPDDYATLGTAIDQILGG